MEKNLNPIYVLSESKHGKVWKAIFGKGELEKIKGARKVQGYMNKPFGNMVSKPVTTKQVLAGKAKVVSKWRGDPKDMPYLYRSTITADKPNARLFRQIARGKTIPRSGTTEDIVNLGLK